MLQPKNWNQAMGANWYRGTYRRTGMYKGMGELYSAAPGFPAGSIPDQIATCIGASGAEYTGDCVTAVMQTAGTGGQAQGLNSILPWAVGGLVLVVLLAGGRR